MSQDRIFSDAPKAVKEMRRHSTASSAYLSFDRPNIDLTQFDLLVPGEMLQEGDEFYYRTHCAWYATTCVGTHVDQHDQYFYRRRRRPYIL